MFAAVRTAGSSPSKSQQTVSSAEPRIKPANRRSRPGRQAGQRPPAPAQRWDRASARSRRASSARPGSSSALSCRTQGTVRPKGGKGIGCFPTFARGRTPLPLHFSVSGRSHRRHRTALGRAGRTAALPHRPGRAHRARCGW